MAFASRYRWYLQAAAAPPGDRVDVRVQVMLASDRARIQVEMILAGRHRHPGDRVDVRVQVMLAGGQDHVQVQVVLAGDRAHIQVELVLAGRRRPRLVTELASR